MVKISSLDRRSAGVLLGALLAADEAGSALTRLDEARSIEGASDGFGLGLAVARSTVRAFGGDLVCRARADGKEGAEFVFTFLTAQPSRDTPSDSHRSVS